MTVAEYKKQLRRELIARRRELLRSGDKEQLDKRVFSALLRNDWIMQSRLVLAYVSTPIEVDTSAFIKECFDRNIPVAVPKCTPDSMTFMLISSYDDLSVGMYGIMEPKEYCKAVTADMYKDSVCIVPALSFNPDGYRLGYGKGYYDRFLNGYGGFSAGLCYRSFIDENIPQDNFDMRVDILITD